MNSRLFVCASFILKRAVVGLYSIVMLGLPLSVVAQSVAPQDSGSILSQVEFDKGLALAKGKVCLGCHQIDSKRVGPAFQQIAQRHADAQGSLDYLANAIRQGGRGRWGAVPMPAQPQVSESESRQLAHWILTLKP